MISDSDRVRRSDHISAASIGVTAMTKSRVVKMTGGIADMVPPYAIGDCGAVLDCTSSNRLMRARMSRRGAATEDWAAISCCSPWFLGSGRLPATDVAQFPPGVRATESLLNRRAYPRCHEERQWKRAQWTWCSSIRTAAWWPG